MKGNKKEVQVHMLPTEDKSHIWLRNGLEYNSSPSNKINPQHLYFTSDEEIKDGDWVLGLDSKGNTLIGLVISKYADGYIVDTGSQFKVHASVIRGIIIASTDPKLTDKCDGCKRAKNSDTINTCNCGVSRLPQPTQKFVETYVKQGGINRVLVDYELINNYVPDSLNDTYTGHAEEKLKVNPSDNTIIIHNIVEKTYTKEDMKNAMEYAFMIAKSTSDCEYYLKEY